MLRCAATQSAAAAAMDMSVLERRKAFLQRLYQQQQPQESHTNLMFRQNMSDLHPNYAAAIYATEHHHHHHQQQQQIGFACPEITSNSHSAASNSRGGNVSSSTRKRKAEFDVDDDFKDKGAEGEAGEVQSEITAKTDRETSTNNSSKESVQKPDYIHVRARRGQATDSHSLAERARREKIGKKMKYLQDLVPGCNKVTGKAGMLDEIINYVQSLQKQVEFLSMKLATLNPRLDFSIDDFFAKEIPAYIASFPTQLQVTSGSSLQYNQLQQGAISCGVDIAMNQSQMLPQKEGNSSMPITQVYHDSSSAHQAQMLPTWDAEWQNLFNVGFH